jgi:hypothetical protein
MKNLEKKILMISVMPAPPALRKAALAFAARSLERDLPYARLTGAKCKVHCCF